MYVCMYVCIYIRDVKGRERENGYLDEFDIMIYMYTKY